jgi:hypothetical protein
MTNHLDPPLVPRRGGVLNVLGICRISTDHQGQKSLEDQEALLRRFVHEHYSGHVRWSVVTGRGSGEYLDRKELAQAEELIESRTLDLIIAEDLARLCRRVKAYEICEAAQDCGTRLIAINDHVDTARDDWHLGALFSVFRHESYTRDTGRRIRRTLRNRFAQGASSIRSYMDMSNIRGPGPTPTSARTRRPAPSTTSGSGSSRGATYSEIADWLNAQNLCEKPGIRPILCSLAGHEDQELPDRRDR